MNPGGERWEKVIPPKIMMHRAKNYDALRQKLPQMTWNKKSNSNSSTLTIDMEQDDDSVDDITLMEYSSLTICRINTSLLFACWMLALSSDTTFSSDWERHLRHQSSANPTMTSTSSATSRRQRHETQQQIEEQTKKGLATKRFKRQQKEAAEIANKKKADRESRQNFFSVRSKQTKVGAPLVLVATYLRMPCQLIRTYQLVTRVMLRSLYQTITCIILWNIRRWLILALT